MTASTCDIDALVLATNGELDAEQEEIVRAWLVEEADDDTQHDFVADPAEPHLCAECGDNQGGLNHAHDINSAPFICWEPVLFPED